MAKNYRQLWEDVTTSRTVDEVKAVRTLAGIVADKEGRVFISNLEREDAELCIEILDHVSRDLYSPSSPPQIVSSGHRRTQAQTRREEQFLRHAEKTRWIPWTTATRHDDNGKDQSFRQGTRLGWIRGCQVWEVQRTPRRGENHEDYREGRPPEDKKGARRRYFLRTWGMVSNILLQQFCKEVILWNTLSHPNVLKLVGVQWDMERGQFVTVSEWMAHGNIMEYIQKNHTNRLDLARAFAFPTTSSTELQQQLHGAAQGLKYLHEVGLTHGDLKGVSFSLFRDLILLFDVSQPNILMSNHEPPRACLADFGFTTIVFDPAQPMSCSAQLEGGTMAFMSPELFVPSKFGMTNSLPTPQADIYAFGLVIFQVCEQDWRYCGFSYLIQVLTGEFPFHGIAQTELVWSVLEGLRPDKPEDASSIGFSDSLWGFVQRCWDGDLKSRPKVAEVVTHLEGAAADWKGLMPPCVQAVNVVSGPKGRSGTETFREFEIFILLWYHSSSNGTGGLFPSSSSADPEHTIKSGTTSGLFSSRKTVSTQYTEPLQEEPRPQEAVTKPSQEPQPESRDPGEEPHDDLHGATYPHLNQNYEPPPSKIPQKKRKGFKRFTSMLREFFSFI